MTSSSAAQDVVLILGALGVLMAQAATLVVALRNRRTLVSVKESADGHATALEDRISQLTAVIHTSDKDVPAPTQRTVS